MPRGGYRQGTLIERFNKGHVKTDDCWEWIGTQNGQKNRRYGVIRDNYKQKKAHRVSWELHNGPIPEGKVIRHTCDNRLCVNPDHLLVGTVSDNNGDKSGKHKYIPVHPDKYEDALSLLREHGYVSTKPTTQFGQRTEEETQTTSIAPSKSKT